MIDLAAKIRERVVGKLEQSTDGESYLRSINDGYPAAEVWAQYAAEHPTEHWARGLPIGPEGSPYGRNHDIDCPGCSGTPFASSPRSDSYWSS